MAGQLVATNRPRASSTLRLTLQANGSDAFEELKKMALQGGPAAQFTNLDKSSAGQTCRQSNMEPVEHRTRAGWPCTQADRVASAPPLLPAFPTCTLSPSLPRAFSINSPCVCSTSPHSADPNPPSSGAQGAGADQHAAARRRQRQRQRQGQRQGQRQARWRLRRGGCWPPAGCSLAAQRRCAGLVCLGPPQAVIRRPSPAPEARRCCSTSGVTVDTW